MRRRPMQAWPRGRLNTGGSRPRSSALAVFALLAMLAPELGGRRPRPRSRTRSTESPGTTGGGGAARTGTSSSCTGRHRTALTNSGATPRSHSGPDEGRDQDCTRPTRRDSTRRRRSRSTPIRRRASGDSGRAPDVNGWYNHAVALTWSGSDATSGSLAAARRLLRPRRRLGQGVGSCRDNAGNVASPRSRSSSTPTRPSSRRSGSRARAGSDLVRWTSTSAADTAVVAALGARQLRASRSSSAARHRSFVDKKIQVGLEYVYAIQTTDQAGNASKRITVAGLPKILTLRKMAYVPRAAPNPILRWRAGARRELLPRAALPRLEANPRRLAGARASWRFPRPGSGRVTATGSSPGSTAGTPGPASAAGHSRSTTGSAAPASSFRRDRTMRDALRPVVALCVVSLVAAAMPGAAAADTPTISSSIDGIAGNNSWWRGSTHGNNVILHWTVTGNPPLTNTTGCDPAITIPGPTTGVTKTCTATNDDGTSSSSRTIKIDADPPTGVSASPARAPDANGWYNHSVGLTWSGATPPPGSRAAHRRATPGPDDATASASGTCQDNAGNSTRSVCLEVRRDGSRSTPGLPRVGRT